MNEGGPYGSKVLPVVKHQSDAVWSSIVADRSPYAEWLKASIQINGHEDGPWTAEAIPQPGIGQSSSPSHEFVALM